MGKKSKELSDDDLMCYRDVLAIIELNLAEWDNAARHPLTSGPLKRMAGTTRDAWIIARDALLKVVRREQERRHDASDV